MKPLTFLSFKEWSSLTSGTLICNKYDPQRYVVFLFSYGKNVPEAYKIEIFDLRTATFWIINYVQNFYMKWK